MLRILIPIGLFFGISAKRLCTSVGGFFLTLGSLCAQTSLPKEFVGEKFSTGDLVFIFGTDVSKEELELWKQNRVKEVTIYKENSIEKRIQLDEVGNPVKIEEGFKMRGVVLRRPVARNWSLFKYDKSDPGFIIVTGKGIGCISAFTDSFVFDTSNRLIYGRHSEKGAYRYSRRYRRESVYSRLESNQGEYAIDATHRWTYRFGTKDTVMDKSHYRYFYDSMGRNFITKEIVDTGSGPYWRLCDSFAVQFRGEDVHVEEYTFEQQFSGCFGACKAYDWRYRNGQLVAEAKHKTSQTGVSTDSFFYHYDNYGRLISQSRIHRNDATFYSYSRGNLPYSVVVLRPYYRQIEETKYVYKYHRPK